MYPPPKPNPTYKLKLGALDTMLNPEGNWEQTIQNNLMGFVFIGNQISERTSFIFIIMQQELHFGTLCLPMGRGKGSLLWGPFLLASSTLKGLSISVSHLSPAFLAPG